MISETPLPTPYSVMISPSQVNSIVPAVIEMTMASVPSGSWSKPKFLMMGAPPPVLKLIRLGAPYACARGSAIGIVL